MIYNYLFYKSAQLYRQNTNKIELSLFEGIIWVLPCFIFNIFSVVVLIELILNVDNNIASYLKNYKYLIAAILMGAFVFYYSYQGRWQKILTQYAEKERLAGKSRDPLLIVVLWYGLSVIILILLTMYKRGDGIFG